jgi:hypothetical protein
MKNFILMLIIICGLITTGFSQTPSSTTKCSIKYSYDAAGNRVKREYICETVTTNPSPSARKPNPKDATTAAITSVVFPNPSNGMFTIQTNIPVADAIVMVYDLQGKLLKRFNYTGNSTLFDIRALAVGQYMIQLVLADGTQVHQLQKVD